ncbi:MAG TPA: hypothetical protein VFS05_00295 [Gemmatimonadaceae bacterium]|nr:hypothetical protein [Gemmatimonadaceae bacterium]
MARNGARPASSRGKTTSRTAKTATRGRAGARTEAKTPGISRIDQASTRTHGYVVRLEYQRTDTGWRPKHTAFFGDASHGGKEEALRAAEAFVRKVKRTGKAPAKR